MSKGSNTTRSGGGSTARVVSINAARSNSTSSYSISGKLSTSAPIQQQVNEFQPSTLSRNASRAEKVEDELLRTESYNDIVTEHYVGNREMGRNERAEAAHQLQGKLEKRLEELDKELKKLTGRSYGYSE